MLYANSGGVEVGHCELFGGKLLATEVACVDLIFRADLMVTDEDHQRLHAARLAPAPAPDESFFAQSGPAKRGSSRLSEEEQGVLTRDVSIVGAGPDGVLSSPRLSHSQILHAMRVAEAAYDEAQALSKRVAELAKQVERLTAELADGARSDGRK